MNRRQMLAWTASVPFAGTATARAGIVPDDIIGTWYRLALTLTRHTPIYSPPVASRTFAYMGVASYEAVASGSKNLQTLAGQLHGLSAVPTRDAGVAYDDRAILNATLSTLVKTLYRDTGPTGQMVLGRVDDKMNATANVGISADVLARSIIYGEKLAAHILDWSKDDGGAVITNMGFPETYDGPKGPQYWVPTNTFALQQKPLLPDWGKNRSFALTSIENCQLPPPPAYSEDKQSEFYKQALEVCQTGDNLTPEQKAIARFWSDDAMLSVTPPGHWISIALQIFDRDKTDTATRVGILSRLGITMADAFIACWHTKYTYNLVRPVSYIKRIINPKWEPLLTTPPFPEYPSGHSVQSAAAAEVLTQALGDNFVFEDQTGTRDGKKPRSFKSFREATNEAAISRLYGGIHYRAAIEKGQEQGRKVATYANALKMKVL